VEPVRHAEMELALLQASLPAGSEELQRCANLAGHSGGVCADSQP
jgi:hypothetical protein